MKKSLKVSLKVILITLAIISSYPEAYGTESQKEILITDFGYEPGSRKNAIPAVKRAIEECRNAKEAITIVFPNGRYDFWHNLSGEERYTTGILLENLKNVTIDGDSSEFIFHGNMQLVYLNNCENIQIKNFRVDWDFPFMYQGKYLNTTNDYIDIEFDKNQYKYVIEDEKFFMTGEGWKAAPTGYFNLFDRDTKEILYKTHDGNNGHMFTGKAVEIQHGIVRFYGTPNVKPPDGTFTTFMAGRYITTGIHINNSKNVYLKDLTIYHALSHGVLGTRSENITMDNTNMQINEKKERVFSVIADASHFTNCKGYIKVINCAHRGAMDDFINVHGAYTEIDTVTDKYTVVTKNEKWVGAPGEEVWFVNPGLCQRSEIRSIESVERLANRSSKITFTSPLPDQVKSGDYIENKTWTASLELRNCKILKNHRARGILFTTPQKVTIEDNYFRTAGTAILIEGDMDYWFESGANRDVTIRNNTFDNCVTSGCITGDRWEWGEAVISITPSHRPVNEKTIPYHQNIHIENNVFRTFDVPLVHARSVNGLFFRNNEIVRTYAFEPYLWQKSSFLLDGCRQVVVSENTIDREYMTRTINASHMKKSDIKSEGFSIHLND
jgi:hypothetical protein